MRADERDVLYDVWLRSVRATHDFVSEADLASLMPLVRDYLASVAEMWVLAEGDGEVIGFMGMGASEIDSLFVSPEAHRSGAGRMLVAHARAISHELIVSVNEQNSGAVAFYLACGFRVEGRSEIDGHGLPYPLLHMRLTT